MKIYIAIVNDHHCDTLVYAFRTPEKAIAYVKAMAEKYWKGEIEEEPVPGWLYSVRHYEDSACVIEQELDAPPL